MNDIINDIYNGHIELLIAIIEQAKKDYKKALKDCDVKTKRDCEKFFLSFSNGNLIIERCRREERGVI
jgi:hypothetical protein